MPKEVAYRLMECADAESVSRLILDSFTEFIADEYSDKGRAEFARYIQPAAIVERTSANHFVLLAVQEHKVVAVIEIRGNDHVALMFVDVKFQRRGIARELLQRAIALARPAKPALDRVTVNSSRFGVAFYEKLGFRQTGPERIVNGIVFIPMAHQL
ncbi:MAG: GNAT family N-acetyltransferase [Acidobacteria bacterium]|nr:GNAT family N-acetyltransferase [Acidobacteriota bacterium]|tara:strand:- start:2886 stop:3356 length:471 start_codon:yes stop_codon:yes gene_type:complete